jgi:hypothetical protein
MKILLFITGHSQINEYFLFDRFLKTLTLNNICDIFIYCNNPNISNEIVTYYQQFSQTNKQLFITTKNGGYRTGGVEAVSEGIEMGIFKDYDYVIHLHPDVFITDDNYLLTVLQENLDNDTVFFITKSRPKSPTFFSFDFFIFKPNLLRQNIFLENLYTFTESPEEYLHNMIITNNINHIILKRFNNDNWYPRRIDENLKLWHEHELDKVENELKNRNL